MLTTTHTNKATGQIENPKVRDIVDQETPLSRGKPFGLGSLPETQETTFMYVPSFDGELLREVNRLKTQVQEKDKAFLSLTEQLNKMNAYMMNRFADYDGSGSGSGERPSGTGPKM
ncbi:unnamed protein product [Cochlearia groenlandica]